MQPFTVLDDQLLRQSPVLQVTYGCRVKTVVANQLVNGPDLSSYMSPGSSIASDVNQDVHRSCTLVLDSSVFNVFDYLKDYVQPYMTVTNPNTGQSLTVNLGVYVLQTPPIGLAAMPSAVSFTGYDLLTLLQAPIGDSYVVNAGVDPAEACVDAIEAAIPWAQVQALDTGLVSTQTLSFPLTGGDNTYRWMDVLTSITQAAGYLPVWVDWEGVFQVGTLPLPTLATFSAECSFRTIDPSNMIAEDRQIIQDLYDVPNKWVFIMNNLADAPVEGQTQYTLNNAGTGPTSQSARGRVVPAVYFIDTATADSTSYAQLQAAGQKQVLSDLNPAETYSFNLSIYPLFWHYDRVALLDPALVDVPPDTTDSRSGIITQWNLAIDGSSDMSVTFQTLPNLDN